MQNVDRTKVIPVRTVMRAPTDDEADRLTEDDPSVSPHTSIAEVLPRVLETDGPVAIRDSGGNLKGVVTQDDVMSEVTRNASNVTQTREASRQAEKMKTA